MMHFVKGLLLPLVVASLFLGGCNGHSSIDPTAGQYTYGDSIDATDAIPVPALTAEPARYTSRRVTVDGRIVEVTRNGCTLLLASTDGPPLQVDASRSSNGACAWQLPDATEGFAVAAGTLRTSADTLHLTSNGVQITPLQPRD